MFCEFTFKVRFQASSSYTYCLLVIFVQIFGRMLTAFESLLRNVLSTQPGPEDPDCVEMTDATEAERPSIDDDLFLKPNSSRYGFGRLMPKELDRTAARFSTRPLQNLELVDTLPTRLSIATLPLLALQVLQMSNRNRTRGLLALHFVLCFVKLLQVIDVVLRCCGEHSLCLVCGERSVW